MATRRPKQPKRLSHEKLAAAVRLAHDRATAIADTLPVGHAPEAWRCVYERVFDLSLADYLEMTT